MLTDQLSMVNEIDSLIAIIYSSYARETVELVELGLKCSASKIAITYTYSQVNPLTTFSNLCFVLR